MLKILFSGSIKKAIFKRKEMFKKVKIRVSIILIFCLLIFFIFLLSKGEWWFAKLFKKVHANKKNPYWLLCIFLFSLGILAGTITYSICEENNPLNLTAWFNVVVFLFSSVFLCCEKKNYSYITIFLLETLIYIELYYFLSYLNRDQIKKFSSDPEKYTSALDMNNTVVRHLLLYSIVLLLIIIIFWIMCYFVITTSIKIKQIYTVELKIIYIKSVIQSIVSFIAISSLTTSGLKKGFLLLAMYIYSYATFIYPLLDLNKYVCQKEIERQKEIEQHLTKVSYNF